MISGNTSYGFDSGIFMESRGANVEFIDSTISGSEGNMGRGITAFLDATGSNAGTLTFNRSAISNYSRGGATINSFGSAVSLVDTTISGNSRNDDGDGGGLNDDSVVDDLDLDLALAQYGLTLYNSVA